MTHSGLRHVAVTQVRTYFFLTLKLYVQHVPTRSKIPQRVISESHHRTVHTILMNNFFHYKSYAWFPLTVTPLEKKNCQRAFWRKYGVMMSSIRSTAVQFRKCWNRLWFWFLIPKVDSTRYLCRFRIGKSLSFGNKYCFSLIWQMTSVLTWYFLPSLMSWIWTPNYHLI